MDKSRLEISPGVWLDHRRALFLETEGVLAVSDLHLGYSWAHRFSGQMMPLQPDGARERLAELRSFYKPHVIAILGDIVHRAVPVKEIKEEFLSLLESLRENCRVKLILGNHDKGLKELFQSGEPIEFHDAIQAGRFLLVHGNEMIEAGENSTVVMGHEHPAISLGDGVRSAKFPCFLASEYLVVLPAFSPWAAGSDIRSSSFLSPLARATGFQKAIAILNGKLLPIPL